MVHHQTAGGTVPRQAAQGTVPQQAAMGTMLRERGGPREVAPSDVSLRLAGALLALAVAAVHVADQGGVTALGSPAWLGWSFRLVEAGGAATALVLLLSRPARIPAWAGWAAAALLGAGPFLGYILSRNDIMLMIIWFFFCLTGIMPVANGAHAAGLGMGVLWGALSAPRLRQRMFGK